MLHNLSPSPALLPDLEALASRVTQVRAPNLSSPCWNLWSGDGLFDYQPVRLRSGRWVTAYLWLYLSLFGPPQPGGPAVVDHLCENKRCVNPEHLEGYVTVSENVRRSIERRRALLSGSLDVQKPASRSKQQKRGG